MRDNRGDPDGDYLDRVQAELNELLRGRRSLTTAIAFLDREFEAAAGRGPSVRSHLAFNAGVLSHAANDPAGALVRLQRSVSLDPTNPQHLLATVTPLTDLGRFDEALTACQQAKRLIAADPFWQFLAPQATGYEGATLVASGRTDEALQLLDQLETRIASDPASTRWCDLHLVHALTEARVARERCGAYVVRVASRARELGDLELLQRVKPLQSRLTT